MFTIVKIDTQGVETLLTAEHSYEYGSTASQYAKQLTKSTGIRHVPRKVPDTDWRAREGLRAPMPEGWDVTPIADHFLHVSTVNSDMIAFTPSVEHGEANRQTRMRPGAYLNRFYPQLHSNDIKRLVAVVQPAEEVLFAHTPDAIEYVYEYGPRSCMGGPHEGVEYDDEDEEEYGRDPFDSSVHPVRVYGAGDLAVAYLKNRHGGISSRCVVWPEKLQYASIYGDNERMRAALNELGYHQGNLVGAKLLKIVDDDDEYLVMPYLDRCQMVRDDGTHLTITDQESETCCYANSTDGLVQKTAQCERYPHIRRIARDMYTVQQLDGTTQQWSYAAVDAHARECRVTRRYFSLDAITVNDSGCVGIIPTERSAAA